MIVEKRQDERRYASIAREVTKAKRLGVGIKKAERSLKTLRLLHNYYESRADTTWELLHYYNLLFFVG
jgi:hypothetical protein